MDNDDMFQYLGGLSLAVKKESGQVPETLVTMQRIPDKVEVEDVSKTIGRELRSRYFNPKWIEGMKKEDYAGAREMAKFVEYMWGWQVKDRKELHKKLNEGFTQKPRIAEQKGAKTNKDQQEEVSKAGNESKTVEGYKMEEMKAKDETTDLSSSGVQWFASLFIMLIIGLFVYGVKRVKC